MQGRAWPALPPASLHHRSGALQFCLQVPAQTSSLLAPGTAHAAHRARLHAPDSLSWVATAVAVCAAALLESELHVGVHGHWALQLVGHHAAVHHGLHGMELQAM